MHSDTQATSPLTHDPWLEVLWSAEELDRYVEKVVHHKKFSPKSGKIEIVPLGDLHVGHKTFNRQKLQLVLDYIEQTPDAYTV